MACTSAIRPVGAERSRGRIRLAACLLLPAVSVPSALGAALEASAPPRTVEDLLGRVDRWVVSIRVEREEDVAVSRREFPFGGLTALDEESKSYFRRPQGYVTGLLADGRGLVLTSRYNVLGTLRSIRVRFSSGSERTARLVASSEADDLALLEVEDAGSLDVLREWQDPPWARSSPPPGTLVFAVGRAPHPERLTVTNGVISALGRNGNRSLQTDAKLNYGNVGGPLIDLDGRIVAVTGFVGHVYPQWGLNSGIGFGATVETLRSVLPLLAEGTEVEPPEPPFLGVESDLSPSRRDGALVSAVLRGSAAGRAGVEKDDLVIEFDGVPVASFHQLRFLVSSRAIGDEVVLKVRRGGNIVELKGVLGKRPARR